MLDNCVMDSRLRSEIPDERSHHPHAFANEAGSCPMNGREKIASRVINSRQLFQVDFDLMLGASCFWSIMRARCKRTLTLGILIFNASAVSLVVNSSTSRRRKTC